MQLKYIKIAKFIFIFFAVLSVYLFVAPTEAHAGGVNMVVKIHKHLADGSIIENPPVDVQINWAPNPNDPPGDGCNDSGQITYMGADAIPGVSNSYNGPTYKLYSGTRETAVWRENQDYSPSIWEWTGTGGGIGACGCTQRRATVTLDYNGTPVTLTELFKAPSFTDGGPFNNWTDIVAEFNFYPPGPLCYTPTPTPAGVPPEVKYLVANKSVIDNETNSANTRRLQTSGNQVSQGGSNKLNTLSVRTYVKKGSNPLKEVYAAFYRNSLNVYEDVNTLATQDIGNNPQNGFLVMVDTTGTRCGSTYCVLDSVGGTGKWTEVTANGTPVRDPINGNILYSVRLPTGQNFAPNGLIEADYPEPPGVYYAQWEVTMNKAFNSMSMNTTGFAFDTTQPDPFNGGPRYPSPTGPGPRSAVQSQPIDGVPICGQ